MDTEPAAGAVSLVLALTAAEQQLVSEELQRLLALQRDERGRALITRMITAVEAGVIDETLMEDFSPLLEQGLVSGFVRHRYGADGETALNRLYARTPRGKEITETAAAVTRALAPLRGQRLDAVQISTVTPGIFTVLIDTEACQVTLRFHGKHVGIENLAIGI
ncbi:MAG: hypothetical protein M1298_04525 [Chloroflexi bacterium]|nr:hypothetical protein [Chloroflexota bacterium]